MSEVKLYEKIIFMAILITATLLLVSSCQETTCPPDPYGGTRRAHEEFIFPNDTFPDGIIFETEFATYTPDSSIIKQQ